MRWIFQLLFQKITLQFNFLIIDIIFIFNNPHILLVSNYTSKISLIYSFYHIYGNIIGENEGVKGPPISYNSRIILEAISN